MKKISILLLGVILSACSTDESVTLILENLSEQTRIDAGITISRDEIAVWTEVNDTLLPMLLNADGSILPSQVDDFDGDGSWDELFVVTDFAGKEQIEVRLAFTDQHSYPKTPCRTNIRLANKKSGYTEVKTATRETHSNGAITNSIWQMEGPAWENDFIAFRNYLDQRNGMDIFGKVTHEMVMDSVGHKDFPSYHEFNPNWGFDILKVGESLGAGSIAYLYNDSLYRVGDNGAGTYMVLAEGPLRSILRFEFNEWSMNDIKVNVVHDVSIQAGTFFYESKVSYSNTDQELQLVSGIVNKKSNQLYEVTDIEGSKAFYTHDFQSLDNTLLCMSILTEEDRFISTSTTRDAGHGIIETYCIHMNALPGEPVKFRFYAFWEIQDEKWADPKVCEEWLRMDADFINNPILVKRK